MLECQPHLRSMRTPVLGPGDFRVGHLGPQPHPSHRSRGGSTLFWTPAIAVSLGDNPNNCPKSAEERPKKNRLPVHLPCCTKTLPVLLCRTPKSKNHRLSPSLLGHCNQLADSRWADQASTPTHKPCQQSGGRPEVVELPGVGGPRMPLNSEGSYSSPVLARSDPSKTTCFNVRHRAQHNFVIKRTIFYPSLHKKCTVSVR